MAYVHTTPLLNGKLGPRGKKCMFICYSSHLKGYVFFGELKDKSVTKIESLDVNFFEEEFPSKGEVSQNSDFYELDESAPRCPVEQEDLSLHLLGTMVAAPQ